MDAGSPDLEDIPQSFLKRVYYAARDGMAIALHELFSDKSDAQIEYLINQNVLEEDGQCCTPLIVAAGCGRDKVVKMLLEKFKPDLELEGTVKFDSDTIKGASALWCAAGAGHLAVVKTLVKAGADVNHATKANSTPVRAACFDGRLDIVKYLTEHKADINISNKFNNTCLMIAAYKGHLDIVIFLLEKGANPNEKAYCGTTALHFAAECGYLEIVSKLLEHGAEMTKTINGMTPLTAAAEKIQVEVVKYLVERPEVTKEEIIDAYELLGASFANSKDRYCLSEAYEYLHKAMVLRYSDPQNVIRKVLGEPIEAYENRKECETLDELERIKLSPHEIHMESLAIKERILGRHSPEVPYPIIFRGAVYADNGRFNTCIDLWLHALKLKQLNDISTDKDLLRFAQVFSQIIHVGVDLDFSKVLSVLEASVTELSRNKIEINSPESQDEIEQYIEEMESKITTTLYILTILMKLLALNGPRYDKQDIKKAYHLVHRLCALDVRLRDGQTLLHLAVNADTPVDNFYTNDVCKFPCAATAKLLVKCGADPNAMDNERNTPLHVIVGYKKPISDFITLHSIILDLVDAGAHMDTVNSSGKTPYDAVATGVAELILRSQTILSLKCMAAKVVKAYNLSYSGNVPRSLESFIELHGPGLNQG